jgi:RNA polymerase sigma-70 factor (ECF subfamily)
VERAIRGLPAKYRDALILRTVQDLPYAEVAEALDIPETTARSLVHRGKSLLLPKLAELMRPDG